MTHRNCRTPEARFLDLYRKGAQWLERKERRAAAGDPVDFHSKLAENWRDNMQLVENAIFEVKNEYLKNLLYYRFIKLLSYEETAEILGRNPQAVARATYRAIKEIKIPEGVNV